MREPLAVGVAGALGVVSCVVTLGLCGVGYLRGVGEMTPVGRGVLCLAGVSLAPGVAAYVFSRPGRALSGWAAAGYGVGNGLAQLAVVAAVWPVGGRWWIPAAVLGLVGGPAVAGYRWSRSTGRPRKAPPPVHSPQIAEAITLYGEELAAHWYSPLSTGGGRERAPLPRELELALDTYERAKTVDEAQVLLLLAEGRAALERLDAGAREPFRTDPRWVRLRWWRDRA
ncbi:hypothetical protein SRB5_42880 [Streptomyces sp. RB5]|uniref:Uncharacterized protein n=1 Tax=Streptomyces smaragdinus TaxID=2585196 RepID=A0A7K0CKV8_9ACTN|nr:hypothetical protein [Streptomyces smaragdinus]MQY14126.1 hypothetical protein [Streptomyces smaragdinus]